METRSSRRTFLTYSAVALVGTALPGGMNALASTQTPGGAKAGTGDPRVAQGDAIKTRTASCCCGQLTVTTEGPSPERRSLCHCKNCQMRTGSAFAIQARFPRDQVTIKGKSKAWKFPVAGAEPVTYHSCDSGGVTYHFCPECGANVYYLLDAAPDFVGVRVGAFTDPTFPQPNISGFEKYRFPWVMNLSAIPMAHANCGEIGRPCPIKT